jgi:alpha-aminoadipic semialdehyde synthase
MNNELVEIESGGALLENCKKQSFLPGFRLEGFPNRDSLIYKKLYGIPEAHTVLRGTLRFEGFANTMKALNQLNLINANPHPVLHPKGPEMTWRQLICHMLGQIDSNMFYDNLRSLILKEFDGDSDQLEALEELGLLDETPVQKKTSLLDTLSHYLSKKCAFEKGERDLVILRHEITALWPDGKRELRDINLVTYGDAGGYSAMSKTVGYPAAIAAKMILDGEIQAKGLVYPFTPDIYRPMLNRLRAEGISATEKKVMLVDRR